MSIPRRIRRNAAALAVIDVQAKLLPAMQEPERVVRNCATLCKAAGILGLPVLVTEQYKRGLGDTDPKIVAAIRHFAAIEKMAFSACGADGFLDNLRKREKQDVVLCGIESHVCVSQTALDLLDEGFRVWVVSDAVSSRTEANHRIGLERMRNAGAEIVSVEMVLFELLGRAGTEEFKQVLALIK